MNNSSLNHVSHENQFVTRYFIIREILIDVNILNNFQGIKFFDKIPGFEVTNILEKIDMPFKTFLLEIFFLRGFRLILNFEILKNEVFRGELVIFEKS